MGNRRASDIACIYVVGKSLSDGDSLTVPEESSITVLTRIFAGSVRF